MRELQSSNSNDREKVIKLLKDNAENTELIIVNTWKELQDLNSLKNKDKEAFSYKFENVRHLKKIPLNKLDPLSKIQDKVKVINEDLNADFAEIKLPFHTFHKVEIQKTKNPETANTQINLRNAMRNNNIEEVDNLLAQFSPSKQKEQLKDIVSYVDDNGQTLLHLAASQGQVYTRVAKILIDAMSNEAIAKASVGNNYTALHLAVHSNNQEIVEHLLDRNISGLVGMQDVYGRTALHLAAENGNLDIVKLLVEKGAKIEAIMWDGGETVLLTAARSGQLDVVKWLATPKDKDGGGANIEARDNAGMTALFGATVLRNLEMAKCLIDNDADVNAKETHGRTALLYATERGRWEVVKFLVEQNADVKDKDGKTTLLSAAMHGKFDVVKCMVEKGADANAIDGFGWTVLHFAGDKGNWDIVKWLINERKVGVKDIDTALYLSVMYGDWEIVEWLIDEKKADVNTTLHGIIFSTAQGNLEMAKWLIDKKGADANATDKNGKTMLYIAAENGNFDIVEWLIKNTRDIVITTEHAEDILHFADLAGIKEGEVVNYFRSKINTEESSDTVAIINEIVYDNKLLNHPNLLKEPLKEFSLSQILNLSTGLDQDLLSEAIAINDSSLILGGLISLSGNNSNDSSYD